MMTEYKPDYADPNDYERMKIKRRDYEAFEQAQFEAYLKKHGILTREQLTDSMNKMIEASKNRESSFLQKVGSWIWFTIKPELTPKRLAYILSNTDKVLPFVNNKALRDILEVVDKLAGYIYESWE